MRAQLVLFAALLTCVPVPAPAAEPPAADVWEYRVEPGDTLIGLRTRYMRPDASWRAVQRLNRLRDAQRLQPGSWLRIPVTLLRGEAVDAEVVHAHG